MSNVYFYPDKPHVSYMQAVSACKGLFERWGLDSAVPWAEYDHRLDQPVALDNEVYVPEVMLQRAPSLHVLTYVCVDQTFAWSAIAQDLSKRPFINIGFLAWLTLVPLAATSNAAARRGLDPRNWQRLHRLVYVAASLGGPAFHSSRQA